LLFGKGDEHVASNPVSEEIQTREDVAFVSPSLAVDASVTIQDIETEYSLDANKFKKEIGFCWQADLTDLPIEAGDSVEIPHRSSFLLCEDGRPLGTGHSSHQIIRNAGRGLFSHWGKQLFFSTSDNSDPHSNRRKYTLKHADALERAGKAEESEERRTIRRAALKKLGLTKPFLDEVNAHQTRYGNGKAEFLDFGILDENEKRVRILTSGKKYTLFSRAVFYEDVRAVSAGFTINNVQGTELYGVNSGLQNKNIYQISKGSIVETRASITMWLTNGEYFMTIAIADPEAETDVQFDLRFDALQFEIGFRSGIHTTSIVNLDENFSVTLL
jgi:hypothetical protein